MPSLPDRRWSAVPVWGIYLRGDDVTPVTGSVRLTLTQRITRVDGRVVYPEGATVERTIGDTTQDPVTRDAVRAAWRAADEAADGAGFDGAAWDARWDQLMAGAVFAAFPASDDPDIVQQGYEVKVEERLSSGAGKVYYIQPLLAHLDSTPPGINLGLVEVPPGSPNAPAPIYAKGLPGGVAALSVDGDVLNAAGEVVGVPDLTGKQDRATLAEDVAAHVTDGSTLDTTLRAASVAAVEDEPTVAPTGAWDFTQAPTVNGSPLGSGGGGTVADATTTTKGVVELATNTETTTGTDTTRAVTPAGVKAATDALATVAHTGAYTDLSGRPTLAAVATSGSYTDLTSKPTIPAAYTDEQARDAAAAMITSGTHTGISVAYDDAGDSLSFTATGTTSPDATTTTKGIVQLAGDLGGTAAAPTVPGLAGKANTTHTHAAADIASGTIAAARLGSGTANSGTVLYGDNVWRTAPSGGSGTASPTEADYVISLDGSTVTATPRTAALAPYSGNDASTVIQSAIDALTPAGGGTGSAGGRIHITRGQYMLSNELVITGWENNVNPVSQLVITGDGHNTQLIQNTAGQNGLVVKNAASFVLRDLRIYAGSSALSALLLDKTGTLEQSCMSSEIDNVSFESDSTNAPAGYFLNFFDLHITIARFMASHHHGLVLENDSTGTSYGNSHFGFLRCASSNSSPYAGLVIRTVTNNQWMNMLSFDNYECIQGYYGIYGDAAWNSTFGFVDIESTVQKSIYLTGTSANLGTRNLWFQAGYLWPGTGGTAITCTQYSGACKFDLYIETVADNTAVPIDDAAVASAPNDYSITLNNASSAGLITRANTAGRLHVRQMNGSSTDSLLDAKIAGDGVTKVRALTQAEYDALTPDASTLYVITG